jgi:hypothetical protein
MFATLLRERFGSQNSKDFSFPSEMSETHFYISDPVLGFAHNACLLLCKPHKSTSFQSPYQIKEQPLPPHQPNATNPKSNGY